MNEPEQQPHDGSFYHTKAVRVLWIPPRKSEVWPRAFAVLDAVSVIAVTGILLRLSGVLQPNTPAIAAEPDDSVSAVAAIDSAATKNSTIDAPQPKNATIDAPQPKNAAFDFPLMNAIAALDAPSPKTGPVLLAPPPKTTPVINAPPQKSRAVLEAPPPKAIAAITTRPPKVSVVAFVRPRDRASLLREIARCKNPSAGCPVDHVLALGRQLIEGRRR